eukprot:TRINITY_DN1026_c0_g1_i2.p2 TRINITY_DN1026_c0_g1~~TRINITY_DN1026_c0_g1_i2.p2  ORF type:complete len:239 (-),score=100.95 TRINITY_DN1026_c0_g1_i2:21-737(-)
MFPEEATHCVEWARDKFSKIFTQAPKTLITVVDKENFVPSSAQEVTALKEAIRLLKKKPETFEDCITYARKKFQKYFINDIRQLIYTYPLDFKTKDGTPFWSLPKRPPVELKFDPKSVLHASFVASLACIRAKIFGIPVPENARTEGVKFNIAEIASHVPVADFAPSSSKAKEISEQVSKVDAPKEEEKKEEEPKFDPNDVATLMKEWHELVTKYNPCLLYTSPSPRDQRGSRMPSSA